MRPLPAWKGSFNLPCAPTGCRCPDGSGFYPCHPTVSPRSRITVTIRPGEFCTHTMLKPLSALPLTRSSRHLSRWVALSFPFHKRGNQGRQIKERARLPGLGLLLGLASGRAQQEEEGRKRDGAFGRWAVCSCWLSGSPSHSSRSRDRNAPLYCWPCRGPSPPLLIL